MDELRESSLLFSLEGLLETERERVEREAREAQRKRDEELAHVAEMAERRRMAAQREREARERRHALEQERERQEQERLEAMKRAVVERARIEAEGNARLREVEQARKHELSLAELRARHRTARYRTFTWLSTGALLLSWAGGVFAYSGVTVHAEAREQQLQALNRADRERVKTYEGALALERSRNQTLQARLEQLAAAPSALPASPQTPPSRPPVRLHDVPPIERPPSTRECVDDGDPLNAQLCRGRRALPR